MRGAWGLLSAALVLAPGTVSAQMGPLSMRVFADGGIRTFTASRSFTAILGKDATPVFGGGINLRERHGVFAEARLSGFIGTGRRVFVFDDHVFPLNVTERVRIMPIEVTAGYRPARRWPVIPYGGGGVGWHLFEEWSPSAADGENVKEVFVGYHGVIGAEVPLTRWIAAAIEGQWTAVPNALGRDPNGVSAAFRESDLGGTAARIKLLVGW